MPRSVNLESVSVHFSPIKFHISELQKFLEIFLFFFFVFSFFRISISPPHLNSKKKFELSSIQLLYFFVDISISIWHLHLNLMLSCQINLSSEHKASPQLNQLRDLEKCGYQLLRTKFSNDYADRSVLERGEESLRSEEDRQQRC